MEDDSVKETDIINYPHSKISIPLSLEVKTTHIALVLTLNQEGVKKKKKKLLLSKSSNIFTFSNLLILIDCHALYRIITSSDKETCQNHFCNSLI